LAAFDDGFGSDMTREPRRWQHAALTLYRRHNPPSLSHTTSVWLTIVLIELSSVLQILFDDKIFYIVHDIEPLH
jgi:hypothetical protein